MLPGQMKDFTKSLVTVTFFVSNIHLWQQGGYFGSAVEQFPLLHTWSLAIEEQYYLFAPLVALFLWWFSTGAILIAVRRADRAGQGAGGILTLAALPLAGLGLWAYDATLGSMAPGAVYLSFIAALAIWGWVELAFLTGTITGPVLRDCPADLPTDEVEALASHALRLYRALHLRDMARIDFRFDPARGPFLLEVNTIPGMTGTSLLPMGAKQAGIDFDALCDRLCRGAIARGATT